MNHNVPRPPQSGARSLSEPSTGEPRGLEECLHSPIGPASASYDDERPQHRPEYVSVPRSYSTPYFGRGTPSSAPRPTGQIAPAPRSYSAAAEPRKLLGPLVQRQRVRQLRRYRGYSAPSYRQIPSLTADRTAVDAAIRRRRRIAQAPLAAITVAAGRTRVPAVTTAARAAARFSRRPRTLSQI